MANIISNEQMVILQKAIARARARIEDARAKRNMLFGTRLSPPLNAAGPIQDLYMGEPINRMAWIMALTLQINWHQEWLCHGEGLLANSRCYTFADFDRDYAHLLPR